MKVMANAEAVGPDGSGAGRPSHGTTETRTSTRPDHAAGAPPTHHPPVARGVGSTRKATRRSVETTAASRSCHARVRCSLKWLPGDSTLTVGRRDCYRRSSASFDPITRSWACCLWCAGYRKLGGREGVSLCAS